MRRLAVLVLLTSVVGCGGDGGPSERQAGEQKQGLSLSVSFTEPLRSSGPVTWTLEVENGGSVETSLGFRSGKDGDVVLLRGGREAYRWSGARFFTQVMRQVRLGPRDRKTFTLEEKALSAPAGDYELVAELASEPAPPPAHLTVEVKGG
ncbi:MAG TPA: BsuPI-related putative proteinase inhibitor [Acidimicrobiia bacterium]|nr:BsuPI-related putative proteinase inhibitor [Acidimicrobiia bacterium]